MIGADVSHVAPGMVDMASMAAMTGCCCRLLWHWQGTRLAFEKAGKLIAVDTCCKASSRKALASNLDRLRSCYAIKRPLGRNDHAMLEARVERIQAIIERIETVISLRYFF